MILTYSHTYLGICIYLHEKMRRKRRGEEEEEDEFENRISSYIDRAPKYLFIAIEALADDSHK